MSKKIIMKVPGVKGLDISSYQGKVDFVKAKAGGFMYCFAKASDGETSHDKTYAMHSADARAAGVLVGAYHFFHFSKDPIKQMDSFIAAMGGKHLKGDLPPVIDVEWTDGFKTVTADGANKALKALVYLEKMLGVTPIVYTSAAFFTDASAADAAHYKRFPLWVASYRTDLAVIPDCWENFTFWQQTDKKSVPGYSELVDGDVFNGSIAELHALSGDPIIVPRPAPITPTPMPTVPVLPATPVAPAPVAPAAPTSEPSFFAKLWAKIKSLF